MSEIDRFEDVGEEQKTMQRAGSTSDTSNLSLESSATPVAPIENVLLIDSGNKIMQRRKRTPYLKPMSITHKEILH